MSGLRGFWRAGRGALAVGLAASALAAQGPPITGVCATPDSIAFRGNKRVTDEMLRGDVGMSPGKPLNYRLLQRATKDLQATGQFDDITITCETGLGKTILVFEVLERRILSDISVSGADRLSASS